MVDPSYAPQLLSLPKAMLAAWLVDHRTALLALARAARPLTWRRDHHLESGGAPLPEIDLAPLETTEARDDG